MTGIRESSRLRLYVQVFVALLAMFQLVFVIITSYAQIDLLIRGVTKFSDQSCRQSLNNNNSRTKREVADNNGTAADVPITDLPTISATTTVAPDTPSPISEPPAIIQTTRPSHQDVTASQDAQNDDSRGHVKEKPSLLGEIIQTSFIILSGIGIVASAIHGFLSVRRLKYFQKYSIAAPLVLIWFIHASLTTRGFEYLTAHTEHTSVNFASLCVNWQIVLALMMTNVGVHLLCMFVVCLYAMLYRNAVARRAKENYRRSNMSSMTVPFGSMSERVGHGLAAAESTRSVKSFVFERSAVNPEATGGTGTLKTGVPHAESFSCVGTLQKAGNEENQPDSKSDKIQYANILVQKDRPFSPAGKNIAVIVGKPMRCEIVGGSVQSLKTFDKAV